MMGISEWAFVAFQAIIIAAVIVITFPLADRLSESWDNYKYKRQQQKLLNKFKNDVKNYIEKSDSLTAKEG